ncbi:MAG: hypothetical protein JXR88_18270 [Clostridia bacterium]|nr:hypothetical protein [Clostridia bacterium]
MSIFDLILIALTMITFYEVFLTKKRFHQILFFLMIDVVAIFLHFAFDTTRWQVFFLYGMPIYVIAHGLMELISIKRIKKILYVFLMMSISLGILFSIAATVLLPIPKMDYHLGPYKVGTTLMNLEDLNRSEIYGPQEGNREIRLQIWYPMKNPGREKALWLVDGKEVLSAMAKSYHMKGFMFNHLLEVESNSYINGQILQSDQGYPVIMMSHGWSSSRIFHLNYGEVLASNGYIVIGIDHTYGALATRLKDGSIAKLDEDILPEEDFLDEGAILIDVYKNDIKFVKNQLENLNFTNSVIKGQMDLKHIGLLGHSTGGAASGLYAMEDELQSVVLLDPWFKPVNPKSITEPLLIICSQEWEELDQFEAISKMSPFIYEIDEARHQDFTLANKLSPLLRWVNKAGPDTSLLQQQLILNHFNTFLKGMEDQLITDQNLNFKEIGSR